MNALKLTLSLLLIAELPAAWALPAPAKPLETLQPGWPEIALKVDIRNLVGLDDVGKFPESEMNARLEAANHVWSQCQVRFKPRSTANIAARDLGVPFSPRSQDDLSKIASALNPHGFSAIPLTIAGPWAFFDGSQRLFLTGLGWVFANADRIDRIGAMISATKFNDPSAGPIIAHELAHALSLPHTAEKDNLMGAAGTNALTRDQCVQARRFAQVTLHDLVSN